MFATEILPGLLVLLALVKQSAVAETGLGPFWPSTLRDLLAVTSVLAGAVWAFWQWLIKPLRKADKAQRDEIARVATFAQSIGGEVHMLADTVKSIENSRDTIQRDLGRLETQVSHLADETKRESERRNQQHAATMQLLGEISGQLKVIQPPRRSG